MQNVQKKMFREFEVAFDKDLYACAFELGKEYLKHYPKHLLAWLMYGITLRRLTHYQEARIALQRVIKKSKQWHDVALIEMGHLYRSKGDLKKAANWYRKSVEAFPEDTPSLIFLGSVLARSGQLKEAEACHRRATECSEGDIDEAYFSLGLVLRAQGRYEEALQCFQKALELDPKYHPVKRQMKDLEKVLELRKTA
jgi:tetratricopeptide (TPR) repeat protein